VAVHGVALVASSIAGIVDSNAVCGFYCSRALVDVWLLLLFQRLLLVLLSMVMRLLSPHSGIRNWLADNWAARRDVSADTLHP